MLPKGFIEIRAVEHPPLMAREYFARGALVKYVGSQATEAVVPNAENQILLVHDFLARGGQGLPFRVTGSPDLNAKLWACNSGWVLWLQYMGAERTAVRPLHLWHVGALMDGGMKTVYELMRRMEADHHALDTGISLEAGIHRAGALPFTAAAEEAAINLREIVPDRATRKSDDAPARGRNTGKRARDGDIPDEQLNGPPVDRAARPIHALLRTLLKDGAKPREYVEQKMEEAGFSKRQVIRAREVVGVVARRRGVKGRRGGGVWLLELPGFGAPTLTNARDVVKADKAMPRSQVAARATADEYDDDEDAELDALAELADLSIPDEGDEELADEKFFVARGVTKKKAIARKPPDKVTAAKTALIELLQNGPMWSSDLSVALMNAGFNSGAITKAKKALGIESRRVGDEVGSDGARGRWRTELPAQHVGSLPARDLDDCDDDDDEEGDSSVLDEGEDWDLEELFRRHGGVALASEAPNARSSARGNGAVASHRR